MVVFVDGRIHVQINRVCAGGLAVRRRDDDGDVRVGGGNRNADHAGRDILAVDGDRRFRMLRRDRQQIGAGRDGGQRRMVRFVEAGERQRHRIQRNAGGFGVCIVVRQCTAVPEYDAAARLREAERNLFSRFAAEREAVDTLGFQQSAVRIEQRGGQIAAGTGCERVVLDGDDGAGSGAVVFQLDREGRRETVVPGKQAVKRDRLLVVQIVGFRQRDPCAVGKRFDANLCEERHTGAWNFGQTGVTDIGADVKRDFLRIARAVHGGQRIGGQNYFISGILDAVGEVDAVHRGLAFGVGINAQHHAAACFAERNSRLVIERREEGPQTVLLLGDTDAGNACIRIIQIDRAGGLLRSAVGESGRNRVGKVFDGFAGFRDDGKRGRLAGQDGESGERLRSCAIELNGDRFHRAEAFVGHREGNRQPCVCSQRGEVDKRAADADGVFVSSCRLIEVDGFFRQASGAAVYLRLAVGIDVFIREADLVKLVCTVSRAEQNGGDGRAVRADGARVDVIEPRARRHHGDFHGSRSAVLTVIAAEFDAAQDVVVCIACAGVIPQDGERIQRRCAFDKGELPVKRSGADQIAERFREVGAGRTGAVVDAQTDVVLLGAGTALDAVPCEDEFAAHGGQLRIFVQIAARCCADDLGAVFRRGCGRVDQPIVDFAVHGIGDGCRSVAEHFSCETGDAAAAAVVERIGFIAPARAVINAVEDAFLLKGEQAVGCLNRAPCRNGCAVFADGDDGGNFLRGVVGQTGRLPGLTVPDRRHDFQTAEQSRLLCFIQRRTGFQTERRGFAQPCCACKCGGTGKGQRAVAVTGEAVGAVRDGRAFREHFAV